MQTLVIGDLHLDDKYKSLLDEQLLTVDKIISKEDPHELILLGDLFMHRTPSPRVFVRLKQYITKWSERCVIHMLRGNHDSANKSDDGLTALEVYRDEGKVYIWNDFGVYNDKYFIPHYENEESIRDCLAQCPSDAKVFGHFGYGGCAHYISESDSIVALSDFQCPTYLGHIHNFKQNGLVTLLGTPYTTNFGEAGAKGYYLILHEPSVGASREEYKEVSFGPRHLVCTLEEVKSKLDYINDPNWFTMLRITLYPEESAYDIPKELSVNHVDVKVSSSFETGDMISKYKPTRDLFAINEQIINDYVDMCDVSPTLTKERLLDGLELLKQEELLLDED